jgi:hypothetical protein
LDKKSSLAIIQAGLGMIRSGNPWEAIAAGAGAGLKSYGEAVDQSQATQQKIMESRLAMESAVNAMKMGNVKDAIGLAQQSKKMDQDLFMSNNHDAVSMTNNAASVNAQLQGALLNYRSSMAGHAIQGGMLDLARAKLPYEQAEIAARGVYYTGRNDAQGGKLDAGARQKAEAATIKDLQMLGIGPNSPTYDAMHTAFFNKHYAMLATGGAGAAAAAPSTEGFSLVK